MKTSFGPWASCIGDGTHPSLSTFWRQRLTMLPRVHRGKPRLARRAVVGLCAAGLLIFVLPTLHGEPTNDASTTGVPGPKRSDGPEKQLAGDNLKKTSNTKIIRGQVVDQQGNPIAGAHVGYWYLFDIMAGKESGVETRSDADGRFTLEVPLDKKGGRIRDSASVWVYSPAHCLGSASPGRLISKKDFKELRIELAPATDTSLVVYDPDGRPVADAMVEPMHYLNQVGYDMIPDGMRPLVGGRTDTEGRVKLPAMARDHFYSVWVTTKDYGLQTQRLTNKLSEPAERTVHLRPVSRIEGRVTAENPEWVRGIQIHFTTEKVWGGGPGPEHRPPWPTEGQAKVVTDHEGRFVIPKIAEGQLSMVQTILDEKLPVRPELPPRSVKLFAGDMVDLELPMLPLVGIRGSIVTEDSDEPLPDIKIHVYYGTYRQGTNVVSDANGRFSARVLPGPIRFQPQNLWKTKYLQFGQPQTYDIPEDAEDLELTPIEVVPSKPLDGQLIDENGRTVADAKVIAYYSNWLCSTAKTKKDGRFTLSKMPVGIEADEATYRIILAHRETRHMHNGDVEIVKADPLVIRVKR